MPAHGRWICPGPEFCQVAEARDKRGDMHIVYYQPALRVHRTDLDGDDDGMLHIYPSLDKVLNTVTGDERPTMRNAQPASKSQAQIQEVTAQKSAASTFVKHNRRV